MHLHLTADLLRYFNFKSDKCHTAAESGALEVTTRRGAQFRADEIGYKGNLCPQWSEITDRVLSKTALPEKTISHCWFGRQQQKFCSISKCVCVPMSLTHFNISHRSFTPIAIPLRLAPLFLRQQFWPIHITPPFLSIDVSILHTLSHL